MLYTIVLSGPSANVSQAKNALVGIGASIHQTDHNWGFPDSKVVTWSGKRDENGAPVEGTGEWIPEEAEYPTIFITSDCEEPLINDVIKSAERLGFVPRSHWPTPIKIDHPQEEVA